MKRFAQQDSRLTFATVLVLSAFATAGCFYTSVPELAEDLNSSDVEVRRATAARIEWRTNPGDSITPIAEFEEALPQLIDALEDSDPAVRLSMANTLRYMGPNAREAGPVLARTMSDEVPEVRHAATIALNKVGREDGQLGSVLTESAVSNLIDNLKDGDPDVVWSSVRLLETIGPVAADAVPALIQTLNHIDVTIVWQSIDALEAIGPDASEAVPELIGLMDRENRYIRAKAATALGSVAVARGSDDARSVLQSHATDPDPIVAEAAADALKRMETR